MSSFLLPQNCGWNFGPNPTGKLPNSVRWCCDLARNKNREARKYFGETTFVSDWNEERGQREFEFRGRRLFLNLFADTVPNLAGGPHRTAELHTL